MAKNITRHWSVAFDGRLPERDEDVLEKIRAEIFSEPDPRSYFGWMWVSDCATGRMWRVLVSEDGSHDSITRTTVEVV